MLKKQSVLFILLLMLTIIACKLFSGTPETETVTPVPADTVLPTASSLPTTSPPTLPATAVAPPATSTSLPLPNTPEPIVASCTDAIAFVADVTIPDNTELTPGMAFAKTWRIQNSGSCYWDEGVSWVFASGAQMAGPAAALLPPIAPGETADVTVDLVAPSNPGVHTGYWQVQLADGTRLSTRFSVRIIVPAPTALPTATTRPAPVIEFFRANVAFADPGDTVQFSWETRNSDWVTLYRIWDYRFSDFWDVDASGVMSYTISENERNSITFMLFAGREGIDENAQAAVTIALTCPDTWFFSPAPDECPRAALYSEGAEQSFENGVMVWVREQDRIYVLFSDSMYTTRWSSHTDMWEEGDPIDDPDIKPPSGFYQPVRGFGLVWREDPNIRDRLGWGISPEMTLATAYQTTSRFKYNDYYLRALDGNVWRLLPERSGWEKIIATE